MMREKYIGDPAQVDVDVPRLLAKEYADEWAGKIRLDRMPDRSMLDPAVLWQEGLVLVYRLLFVLKLECPAEPGAGFSFASTLAICGSFASSIAQRFLSRRAWWKLCASIGRCTANYRDASRR